MMEPSKEDDGPPAAPEARICGLDGCTLPAWHSGICQCVTSGPRARRKPPVAVLEEVGSSPRSRKRVMVPAVTEPSITTLTDDASPTTRLRGANATVVLAQQVKDPI